jgi:hypothetical protein
MSDKKLDALAEEILQIFKERGFDPSYIEEKQMELTGLSRFSVIGWCSNLDEICLLGLASKRGISVKDLRTTLDTLKLF